MSDVTTAALVLILRGWGAVTPDSQPCWRCGGPSWRGIHDEGFYSGYCPRCEVSVSAPAHSGAYIAWDFDEATFYDHGSGHWPSPA